MSQANTVIGWSVDRHTRRLLLEIFPPTYADVIADHVTLKSHLDPDASPPDPAACRIIGRADDGQGVEAMVVEIDGDHRRPDGGVFHITWSLDRERGRRAVESNEVIRIHGWTALATSVEVTVKPARFTSSAKDISVWQI